MLKLALLLIALLWLVDGNSGQQFGDCDYFENILPGRRYDVFNRNFPERYTPGSACRWVARSSQPIILSCHNFSIPKSSECEHDVFTIRDKFGSLVHRYCGDGTFSIVSQYDEFTITLESTVFHGGGTFSCIVEAVPTIDEWSTCDCGWKNPSRIVGGKETGVNEYPMMAGLIDRKLKVLFCGATIINKKQVLTAAHCVVSKNIHEIGVLVGDHDLYAAHDTNATKLFRVHALYIHPSYNSHLSQYDNDIAILTIRGTMSFNYQVGPVCLPFKYAHDTFVDNLVVILGWGSVSYGFGPTNTLQKATVNVITKLKCQRTYRNVTKRQVCTYTVGKDSCQWDSGGPILWRSSKSGRLIEIGIIGMGSDCGGDDPAINARVGAFLGWIVKHTPIGIHYCRRV